MIIQCSICHSTDILKGRHYWSCKKCGQSMQKQKSATQRNLAASATRGNAKARVPSMPVYRFMKD